MRTSNTPRRRLRVVASTVIALSVLVAACGSDDDESTTGTADAAGSAATSVGATETSDASAASGDSTTSTAAPGGSTAPSGDSATPVPDDAEELVIADLESLTGPAASVGVPQANAVKLAADQINATGGVTVGDTTYRLVIETEDDQSDPTAGITAVQKFLSSGRKYMVGTLSSAVVGAYLPIIEGNDDFISVVVGAALEGITANEAVYRPRVTLSQYTVGLSDYLGELDTVTTLALITDNQHAGFVQQIDPLKEALSAKGIEVVADERYTFGATEFSAQLTAMLAESPDALNLRGYPGDVTRIIKQAREQGFDGPIYTTSGITNKEVEDAQATDSMDGVVEVYAPLPTDLIEGDRNADVAQAFEDSYQDAFGEPSGGTSMSAYDGVFILARAFEQAGTIDDVAAVRTALDEMTLADVPELVEPLKPQEADRIFTDRQAYFVLVVREWADGAFHPVNFVD